MLVKIYNMFCMAVVVVVILAVLVFFGYSVYTNPETLITFSVIFGVFCFVGIVINGTEQLNKFFENRDNRDGNKM